MLYHYRRVLFCVLSLFLYSFSLLGQEQDSIKSYELESIEVTAKRVSFTDKNVDPSKEKIVGIFGSDGYSLIRKGVFFAQDLYSDGLKRSDINVVVDGERYHTACPNRMDSPLTRVNPIELESVDLKKSNGDLLSSLGGVVQFNRSTPNEQPRFQTGISGNAGSLNGVDAAFKFEGYSNMASFRYSTGSPYKDADGRSFKDLYGYTDNFNYTLAEGSFQGNLENIKYGGSFTYTEDVSFPYLMMDERLNKVYSAFFSFTGNKVYFNYTDHIMDNAMRQSQMTMTTAAKNLTIGAVGAFYELFYRKWDADNEFVQRQSGNTVIENHLMPNTQTISLAASHKFTFDHFGLSGRLGAINQSMNDNNSQFYKNNYEMSDHFNRWFPMFGISLDYTNSINSKFGYGIMVDASSEAPDLEELYIYVDKPMNKPTWTGNPLLEQTYKAGLRGVAIFWGMSLEVYYSNIWDYVNLTQVMSEGPVQSYNNIDARLMGTNFSFKSQYADLSLSYTYAQNLTNDTPLSEIRPFETSLKLRSPVVWGLNLFAAITYEARQTRIDPLLNETQTPSWYKADIGIKYELRNLQISLEIENLTNQLYYKHLSYLRNPFASGADVFEPGRNLYFSLTYSI